VEPQPEIYGASVVAVGSLNPAIFSPLWFKREGLLPQVEADAAEVEVISPPFAHFKLDWLEVLVTQDQLSLTASERHMFETLRDLAAGALRILAHTPVGALGINHHAHFAMPESRWHSLGHRLVPKQPFEKLMVNPGTRSVILQGERPDDNKGTSTCRLSHQSKSNPVCTSA
jgi:hypothetical protein